MNHCGNCIGIGVIRMKKILITGVDGFIGSALAEALVKDGGYDVIGVDIYANRISHLLNNKSITFRKIDLLNEADELDELVKNSDIVIPLAAIALPSIYVTDPIRIFELDFESNIRIIKQCVKHFKRLIFPSTSEVYGMSQDLPFNEDTSNLVTGPINKQRWIYSSSKQLIDRVIYAYGETAGLDYTIFRPFNWIGPKLDNFMLEDGRPESRAIPKMIYDLITTGKISLFDGGAQRRTFIDIDDAIAALMAIVENKNGVASREIFNIGNPVNECSIKELAEMLISELKTSPQIAKYFKNVIMESVDSQKALGVGYQDVERRVPDISKAVSRLGFNPMITTAESVCKIVNESITHILKKVEEGRGAN